MTAVTLLRLGVAFLPASVAAAQEAQKMFIEGDIVRGNSPNGITGPVCVLANQFKRKENVFHSGGHNTAGQPLDEEHKEPRLVELTARHIRRRIQPARRAALRAPRSASPGPSIISGRRLG